jgi:tetratricopeptide (TPR) repeat protein
VPRPATFEGRTTLRIAIALACLAPAGVRAHAAPAPAAPAVRVAAAAPDSDAFHLARAVAERRAGRLEGVIAQLERIDFTAPRFADADRAAFLLGDAYLALGSRDRFVALARTVAGWPRATDLTRWMAFRLALIDAGDAGASTAGGTPAAALASTDTTTALGRDLAGLAAIRSASAAAARGEDPRPFLAAVPEGSRWSARARHVAGLAALERGDEAAATAALELVARDTTYAERREARVALAAHALEHGRWPEAREAYASAEQDRRAHQAALEALLAGDPAVLWSTWTSAGGRPDALVLDAAPTDRQADALAHALEDLGARPAAPAPEAVPPARVAGGWPVAPPPDSAWRAIARAEHARDEASYALTVTRAAIAREREDLASLGSYLKSGGVRAHGEASDLAARAAFLDSLKASLDALDRRLRDVRDAATRHVLERSADLLRACRDDLLWIAAMRHLDVDPPGVAREDPAPAGRPDPAAVLAAEERLARGVAEFLDGMVAQAPGLIARSYEKAWGPGILDRAIAEAAEAEASLKRARLLAVTIDSSAAATSTSVALRALESQASQLTREVAARNGEAHTLRERSARDAVRRQFAALETEREGIDYGLAVSGYALAMGLSADSTAGAAVADADDSTSVARRTHAIGDLRAFLARHPDSPARGEMRFRLADVLLVDGRRAFEARMARWLAAGGGGEPPVPDPGEPLALYRAIVAQDTSFAHLDAVRFNAAMILADQGSPEAGRWFADVVAKHPGSPYVQESELRLGDLDFAARRLGASVAHYRRASDGNDLGVKAIALYKMGWAQYDDGRYVDAADAFGAVLDLYRADPRAASRADVAREAETYLVQSLSEAGGAAAASAWFDRTGGRPYEIRVLLALGQHERRYARWRDAADADAQVLARHPDAPEALVAAGQMVETWRRAGDPARVRQARLDLAPRFAPGSAWAKAQDGDSLRQAGSEFARTAWRAVAFEHHKRAREHGAREDWRESLQLYEELIAHWPDDPETPALARNAGEAAAALGDYPRALDHYKMAAAGPDSVAAVARWQQVAVTDAWYESTRGAQQRDGRSLGTDSLARAVIQATDGLLAREPNHPRAADLLWREANLGDAHGWWARAATDFQHFVEQFPNDRRTPRAAALRADAWFALGAYDHAGAAYAEAHAIAVRAGDDSLARRTAAAAPVAWYRNAEAVAKGANDSGSQARAWDTVADGWPGYVHAPRARYLGGLAWLNAGHNQDGVKDLEALIRDYPRDSLVRDAHLQVAKTWEKAGDRERAASAYQRFAGRFPADPDAPAAWLTAAGLLADAGQGARADTLRLAYLKRWPGDVQGTMEILADFARREVAGVSEARPVSTLLPPANIKSRKKKMAVTAPRSRLGEYLALAATHPDLASQPLLAQVKFLAGEEARAIADRVRLVPPLGPAVTARRTALDQAVARYRECIGLGVAEWANASAFRMGEALVAFSAALQSSPPPADLTGDDRLAYQDVLRQRGQPFADRGEEVWTRLLREKGRTSADDPWVVKSRDALWPRLGSRFFFRPEVEFPTVAAVPPDAKHDRSAALNARDADHPEDDR